MEEGKNDVNSEDSCSNKGLLNFTSDPPTLKNIASVAFVAKTWTEPDIMKVVRQRWYDYFFSVNIENPFIKAWRLEKYMEKRILRKINENIPTLLSSVVCSFVQPMGIRLLIWFVKKVSENDYFLGYLQHAARVIFWRMNGTIDERKTLIRLINIDYPKKDYCELYKLACQHCLEEYIFDLWDKIPNVIKEEFDFLYTTFQYNNYELYALAYWLFSVRSEWHIMHVLQTFRGIYGIGSTRYHKFNPSKLMILSSIRIYNSTAFKYFWQKFIEEKNKKSNDFWLQQLVCKTFSEMEKISLNDFDFYDSIVKFMLSYVRDPSIQKNIARKISGRFLQYLVIYPEIRIPFNTSPLLHFLLNNISENDYLREMEGIAKEMEFRKLGGVFEEIWSVTPLNLKQIFLKKFIEKHLITRLILSLIKIGHLNTALIVVQYISTKDRELVIHHMITGSTLRYYIKNKIDLDLLDVLLMKLLPLDKNLESLKQNYHACQDLCCDWLNGYDDIEYVDKFLKWAFESEKEIENFKLSLPSKDIYINLILSDNYDNVQWFVKWYFTKENENQEIKSILFDEEILKILLEHFSAQRERSIEVLNKFMNYCLTCFEDVSELKAVCLNYVEYYVKKEQSQFASAMLNWCFDDKDGAIQFKTKLFLSKSGFRKCPPYDCFMLDDMIFFLFYQRQSISDWLMPLSRKLVLEMKKSLRRDKNFCHTSPKDLVWRRKLLFHLFDCESSIEFQQCKDRVLKNYYFRRNILDIFSVRTTQCFKESNIICF